MHADQDRGIWHMYGLWDGIPYNTYYCSERKNILREQQIGGDNCKEETGDLPVPPKVTGDVEAHIIALACGDPPEGYEKWTLRLLADKCVELNYAESLSHMTVSRILKKRI